MLTAWLSPAYSLFSGVEIMDLMSDLGAYASLLYTAALTGAMKIVYTIVVAFALVASLHGVHTRAILILDMQEVCMFAYTLFFFFVSGERKQCVGLFIVYLRIHPAFCFSLT